MLAPTTKQILVDCTTTLHMPQPVSSENHVNNHYASAGLFKMAARRNICRDNESQ